MQNSAFEEQLAGDVGELAYDPLGFVLYAFPWGEPGDLEEAHGPEDWQRNILEGMGKDLRAGATVEEATARAVQVAISSGHGIGKSALVSWIILWALSTCVDARGVVTANTEAQLKGKTWAELAKWHRLCLCGHWFDCTATALISRLAGHEKTWRCDMVPWSERNAEAFAGLHNKGKRVFLIFDEASAIPDLIWETAEGALTDEDTEIIWCAFGNPTRTNGRFRECFGKFRHRWKTRQIDSRSVSLTNKTQLQQWVDDYGEDSDFVKVRVRGEFPSAGVNQLIGLDLVEAAMARTLPLGSVDYAPVVMGIDPSLQGKDRKAIVVRQGIAVMGIESISRPMDTGQVATWAAGQIKKYNPGYVFIDEIGIGAGVRDWIRSLGCTVIGVNSGTPADNKERFVNRRIEMWWRLMEWLMNDSPSLPPNNHLKDDLVGPEYFENPNGKVQLEKKDDMRKRGLASPDLGDALALTFAAPVRRKGANAGHRNSFSETFNPFEDIERL